MSKPNDNLYQPMFKTPITRIDSVARRVRGVHLIPDSVACEGTSTVALIFDDVSEALEANGRVEVSVRSKDRIDRLTATRINQRSFSFKAPENREGDASVVVFVNGAEVASCYLSYRSESVNLITSIAQIYLQFMDTMCRHMYQIQTRHQIPSPMPELDGLLAETFNDREGTNAIPPMAYEEVFDILRHTTDIVQSKYELPSLLHLAATYGLPKLAERLVDLPGAARAGNQSNVHGRKSSDIARNNGHALLAQLLDDPNKTAPVKRPPVEMRESTISTEQRRSKQKVETIFPTADRTNIKTQDDDYVTADSMDDDTYGFFSGSSYNGAAETRAKQTMPTSGVVGKSTACKPPPAPCPMSLHHSNSNKVRSSSNVDSPGGNDDVPPPIPRRESRDSGAYVDGADQIQTTPTRNMPSFRPNLTRGQTDPGSGIPGFPGGRRCSEDRQGSLRPPMPSPADIAKQLSRPVPPRVGRSSKEPSITK